MARKKTSTRGELRASDFQAMDNDVEAAKKYLLEKNNAGILNLELLCLVGAELGGIVATNWIAADWSRQDLPAFKQGKYAKALVLLVSDKFGQRIQLVGDLETSDLPVSPDSRSCWWLASVTRNRLLKPLRFTSVWRRLTRCRPTTKNVWRSNGCF